MASQDLYTCTGLLLSQPDALFVALPHSAGTGEHLARIAEIAGIFQPFRQRHDLVEGDTLPAEHGAGAGDILVGTPVFPAAEDGVRLLLAQLG